jgi:hypothetical protein
MALQKTCSLAIRLIFTYIQHLNNVSFGNQKFVNITVVLHEFFKMSSLRGKELVLLLVMVFSAEFQP